MKQEVCQNCKAALSVARGSGVPPSHFTIGQVARLLGVSNQAINQRIRRGTLPVETWHETKMVPSAAVMKALDRRNNTRRKP
jgi:hypothetical protein